MRIPLLVERLVPPARRPVPVALRLAAVPMVAAVAVVAIWAGGALVSDDFGTSVVATTLLLTVAASVALVVSLRWRQLASPVLLTFALVSGGLGGYLIFASTHDVRVDDRQAVDLVRAVATPRTATPGPVRVAGGEFHRDAHATTGTATVIRLPDGRHVLTLTTLATDPGPDLRVYLVPGTGRGVDGHLDLGRLKGNKGDQRYEVPASADPARYDRVVIWCRAFSVAFGTAALT